MRKYYKNWKRIFLKPDADPAGGGGSQGNPGANQGGGAADDGSSAFVDPTANIDLDDLTPEVRSVVEASRKGFATLQKQAADAQQARLAEEQRRKDFQSNYDKLRVQVEGLTRGGGNNGGGNTDPRAARLQQFTEILKKKGVSEQHAPAQAEIMLDMMENYGEALKAEIGKDLSPFANTIVEREAQFAWQQAVATDKTGALQNPELSQIVWDQVQTMAQNGQQVTAQIVHNLTGIAYFAHLQKGGNVLEPNQPNTMQPQQQPLPNVGRMTYPGSGAMPSRPGVNAGGNNATVLDPATDAALQTVLRAWSKGQGGVKAPGLRVPTGGRK